MSLCPHTLESVPEETARVARAAFPQGHPYLLLRDTLGTIFQDDNFAACFPLEGQPGLPPWRLALVTMMQFRENLAERQATEAVRARIDWKYLLGLALTDSGFDFSVRSAFRDRLLASRSEELLLDKLLERCRAMGWLKTRGQQRTDSTHVLAAMRVLNRLARVAETLRAALNAVATVAPDWLQGRAPVEWYERYGKRIEGRAAAQRLGGPGGLCPDGGGRWLLLPGHSGGCRGSQGGPGVTDLAEPASDLAAPLRADRGRGQSGRGWRQAPRAM
jgi:transposase